MICEVCGKDVIVEIDFEKDLGYLCPECEKALESMICTGSLVDHPGFMDYLEEECG